MRLFIFLTFTFLSITNFAADHGKSEIQLRVFTVEGKVIGETSMKLPLAQNQILEVHAEGIRCDVSSLQNVTSKTIQPFHMTLAVKNQSTSFSGDVQLYRETYLSLNDQVFCLIQLK